MNKTAALRGGMYPERFWELDWSPDWTSDDLKNLVPRELSSTEVERFLQHPQKPDGIYTGCLGDIGDRFFQDKKATTVA